MVTFTGVNPLPHPPTIIRYLCEALLLGGAVRQVSDGHLELGGAIATQLHTGAIATQLHTGAIATQLHTEAMLHTGAIATQLHTGAMLHDLANARDLRVDDLASARD
jgi:hypothetical protein